MTIFDIFASVAYLILDIAAVLSLVGSTIIAIGGVISARRGRRFRGPEQIYMWSGGGLIIGIGGFISLMISHQFKMERTLLLGLSMPTVAVILLASVLLLVVGKVLQGKARQVSFAKQRRW